MTQGGEGGNLGKRHILTRARWEKRPADVKVLTLIKKAYEESKPLEHSGGRGVRGKKVHREGEGEEPKNRALLSKTRRRAGEEGKGRGSYFQGEGKAKKAKGEKAELLGGRQR